MEEERGSESSLGLVYVTVMKRGLCGERETENSWETRKVVVDVPDIRQGPGKRLCYYGCSERKTKKMINANRIRIGERM